MPPDKGRSSKVSCSVPAACRLLLVVLTLAGGAGVAWGAVCEPRQSWLDPSVGECVPCRVCAEHQVVLRPCQDYMNTVCGTMKDLAADFRLVRSSSALQEQERAGGGGAGTDGNGIAVVRTRNHHWKEERRKEGAGRRAGDPHVQYSAVPAGGATSTEEILWDWQVASLLLAIIGCLLFLLAGACVALNQSRQWRRIEKHFDADMEALSVQVVSRLASMQQIESGPIMLENIDGHRLRPASQPIEVRCVYLDQLLDEKCCQKSRGQPTVGNLYIEESIDPPKGTGVGGGGGGQLPPATPACHVQRHY
ncbi:tumor necrosis factor receptor superfamily member wengen [Anopheles bellator]|uniref:tumor necrosis factor receptor superfamily member wengen n=1 Tax=Anopheles bellator TaxID=139047 RepID=UPI0026485C09|nr:tumor necrosis factor receptor superfamily member wengen [Anopheles bellator]